MATALLELIENPETMKALERFHERTASRCCICKEIFTEAEKQEDEIKQTKNGPAHSGCFFELVGEEVEKYPLVGAGGRRG